MMPSDAVLIRLIRTLSRPLRPAPTALRPRVRRLPDIRAVLWDVYGTMLVSGAGEIGATRERPGRPPRAARQALAERAFREAVAAATGARPDTRAAARGAAALERAIRRRQADARRRGRPWPEIRILDVWREAIETAALPLRGLREIAVRYECALNPVWPMPGLAPTLAALRRQGMRLGIVSNAQFYTPLTLAAFTDTGWTRGLFEPGLCVWSFRLGEAKPSPRLLALALRRLARRHGIAPAQTLVVGNDRLNDLLPAARLGCRTALFAGDARSLRLRADRPECRALEPTVVITRPAHLLAALA